jgi:flavin-dependent dehydrogenase
LKRASSDSRFTLATPFARDPLTHRRQAAGMSEHWDLVVVGASFAGAACALAAREYGLRTCVLERKRDPGIKLHTTGIIVREAAEGTWLSRLPPQLVHRVDGVRLHAPNLRCMRLSRPDYYFLSTDTPGVMRWLAGELRDAGVELRLATPFQQAEREGDGWNVRDAGSTRFLVGADGAKSRVAERAGLGRVHDFLYGVEHEFDGMHLAEADSLHCFLSKRFAPGYIGWALQAPTGVQLGLAARYRGTHTPMPDADAFLRHVAPCIGIDAGRKPDAVRAGLVPCGGPIDRIAADGVILTGDAAGIVSPLTAGGIHSAWKLGWAVGEAIARHLRHGGPPPEQVAQQAVPHYRTKRLLRRTFDTLQMDWPFDLLIGTPPLRWAAERVYFDRGRGDPGAIPLSARG